MAQRRLSRPKSVHLALDEGELHEHVRSTQHGGRGGSGQANQNIQMTDGKGVSSFSILKCQHNVCVGNWQLFFGVLQSHET